MRQFRVRPPTYLLSIEAISNNTFVATPLYPVTPIPVVSTHAAGQQSRQFTNVDQRLESVDVQPSFMSDRVDYVDMHPHIASSDWARYGVDDPRYTTGTAPNIMVLDVDVEDRDSVAATYLNGWSHFSGCPLRSSLDIMY